MSDIQARFNVVHEWCKTPRTVHEGDKVRDVARARGHRTTTETFLSIAIVRERCKSDAMGVDSWRNDPDVEILVVRPDDEILSLALLAYLEAMAGPELEARAAQAEVAVVFQAPAPPKRDARVDWMGITVEDVQAKR